MRQRPLRLLSAARRRYWHAQASAAPWRRAVFRAIQRTNAWGDDESLSGPGSSSTQTARLCTELSSLLCSLNVRSLVDAPCGDLSWLSQAGLELDSYVGVDIVPDLIAAHRQTKPLPNASFIVADVVKDLLPQADAILCRDCLVHLPDRQALRALRQFQASGAKYLLSTTFPGNRNHDIPIGAWRALDLEAPPFNLPKPVALLNEGCTEGSGAFEHKSLGVWLLADIRL